MRSSYLFKLFILSLTLFYYSPLVTAGEMPRLIEKNGHHEFLVDGKPYFMLGAQMNNSSDWPSMLPEVWPAIKDIHANTLIGMGGIGFSPFGIDFTGYVNSPLGWNEVSTEVLRQFAEEYELLGPMVGEVAHLSFEGKLKTAVEEKAVHSQVFDFGKWQATVSYGLPQFGFGNNPPGNPNHDGCALVAELGPDEFLVTGIDARVSFGLSPTLAGQHMEYLRVEQGVYENGKWKFLRIWNGDQTDWGLNFKHKPYVLHVKPGTF